MTNDRPGAGLVALALLAACPTPGKVEQPGCGVGPRCDEGWICSDGVCVKPCVLDAECAGDEECRDGLCATVPDAECTWDGECESPTVCETVIGVHCAAGLCHYPFAPEGYPCERDGGSGACVSGLCLPSGLVCSTNAACQPGTCIDETCAVPSGVGGACDTGPDDTQDCRSSLRCVSGICLTPDGGICDANADCVDTCVSGQCGALGGEGAVCDADDDDDCDLGLLCQADAHCGAGVPCPNGNGDCLDPAESCIGGACRGRASTGAACDTSPDDAADCVDGHACVDGICLLLDGQACAANSECVHVCRSGQCAPPSDTLGVCDTGENADCFAGNVCRSGVCRRDDSQPCDADVQCANTCISGGCVPLSAAGGPCDPGDHADCAEGLDCAGSTCLVENGGHCLSNLECVETCISESCAPLSGSGSPCDPGDDDDCLLGQSCQVASTCGPGTPCPGGNEDCTAPTDTCIDDVCRDLAPTGSACDAPADDADCEAGNLCVGGTCLRGDGQPCTANNQCVNVCTDNGVRACRAPSVTNGPCDVADAAADCTTGHACPGGECLRVNGEGCSDNAQCVEVCIIDACAPPSTVGGACDETSDCLAGTCEAQHCVGPAPLRIFVSSASHAGAFGTLGAADDLCRNDANNPLGAGAGVWRALIGVDGTREVGANWVLLPSTGYHRTDGSLIDTTDANGSFGNGLLVSVGDSPVRYVWTGLGTAGAASVTESCSAWTDGSTTGVGIFGQSTSSGRQWVDAGVGACNEVRHLYCVEQR